MTHRERLIDLYGQATILDIQKNTHNVYTNAFPDAENLINNKQFLDLKDEVVEGKTRIEKHLLSKNLAMDSVQEALRFLLDRSIFEFKDLDRSKYEWKMSILVDLILRAFRDTWSTAEKDHFVSRAQRIKCNYLFISYTNRDAKLLNIKYQNLIKEVVDKYGLSRPLRQDDWDRKNLLALVLSRVLTAPGRLPESRVFFDRDDLEPGDHLRNVILPICFSSLQMIQIVTNRVFVYEHENWPYEEYSHFQSGPPIRKSIFTVAAGQNPELPEFPFSGYESWYNTITSDKLYEVIPPDLPAFEQMTARLSKTMRDFLYTDVLS